MKEHYARLNLDTNATLSETKAVFRKLSMVYHPDKGGNNAQFTRLKESYDFIKLRIASTTKKSTQRNNYYTQQDNRSYGKVKKDYPPEVLLVTGKYDNCGGFLFNFEVKNVVHIKINSFDIVYTNNTNKHTRKLRAAYKDIQSVNRTFSIQFVGSGGTCTKEYTLNKPSWFESMIWKVNRILP